MTEIGARALRHIRELRDHSDAKDRPEAAINLAASVRKALAAIGRRPDAGLPYPRPYLDLAQPGELWIKEGRSWFAYSLTMPAVVLAVFFDQADIVSRKR